MALKQFIAGPYTCTYAGVSLGVTMDGYRLTLTPHARLIDETDAYGDAVVDMIARGADCAIDFVSRTWDAATAGMLGAWEASGVTWNIMPAVGWLGSDRALALALTAVAGPSAAGAGVVTGAIDGASDLSASKAIMREGHTAMIPLGPVNRDVPISMRLLPYSSTGIRFFSAS